MELIKTFMGILFLICLSFSINLDETSRLIEKHNILSSDNKTNAPLGLIVQDYKGKVKVTSILEYTPAYNSGIEPGDRIMKVNGCKICNVKTFLEKLENNDFSKPIELTIYRVDSCSTFPVDITPLKISYSVKDFNIKELHH